MEKPTIYSSAPRPPKQIRVVENPVEPIVEKQDLSEKKEESSSTITVMQPTLPKDTVVKLNSEKQEPDDLPKEENAIDSAQDNLSKTDEVINASPQADLETATDFTDNKQIVTVEEPTAATNVETKPSEEIVAKENNDNVDVEEPITAETETNTDANTDSGIKSTDENDTIETPEIADVDAKDAAESSIETKENEEVVSTEKPEIADIDAKANEEPAIETTEKELPDAVDEQEATTNVDIDAKSDEENVSLINDEDIASIAPPNVEQDEKSKPNTEAIASVEHDVLFEQIAEPEVEFVTIAEQYSINEVVEEIKATTETKAPADKISKSSSSSKSKVDAEYDFENLKIPGDDELFQRQYYTMGEVATMFHANQSQIRFWENEFDILQPKKNKKGDRYFRPEDVKNLQVIHHLLRNRRFTIEGAREYLKSNKQRTQDTVSAIASLSQLKSFLIELKANL